MVHKLTFMEKPQSLQPPPASAFHPTNYAEWTEQKWDETLALRKDGHLLCGGLDSVTGRLLMLIRLG